MSSLLTPLTTSRPRSRTRKESPQINIVSSSPDSNSRMAALWATTTSRKSPLFTWCTGHQNRYVTPKLVEPALAYDDLFHARPMKTTVSLRKVMMMTCLQTQQPLLPICLAIVKIRLASIDKKLPTCCRFHHYQRNFWKTSILGQFLFRRIWDGRFTTTQGVQFGLLVKRSTKHHRSPTGLLDDKKKSPSNHSKTGSVVSRKSSSSKASAKPPRRNSLAQQTVLSAPQEQEVGDFGFVIDTNKTTITTKVCNTIASDHDPPSRRLLPNAPQRRTLRFAHSS